MRLRRLQLIDYRNVERCALDLPTSLALFLGDNAQGKSNLLEAAYLLASMRGLRAETDVQLIRHGALDDPIPAARVIGEVTTAEGDLKVEVIVTAREGASGPVATKTVRINGAPKRLSDAVGRLAAVLFTAEDMELIAGPPSLRRKYIDMILIQVDPQYARVRQQFEKVLTQRNHLLKRIREGQGSPDELVFWDEKLTQEGSYVFDARAGALGELAALAWEAHAGLAGDERLELAYRPRLDGLEADLAKLPRQQVAEVYAAAMYETRRNDIGAGMSLMGPHRDDVLIHLNGRPASGFASRAQQRTIALSLRLAEARFLLARRGEPPVLLLDDVLSEMDAGRRTSVLAALSEMDQMLVTGTDWDRFPPDFMERAQRFTVAGGLISQADEAASRGD